MHTDMNMLTHVRVTCLTSEIKTLVDMKRVRGDNHDEKVVQDRNMEMEIHTRIHTFMHKCTQAACRYTKVRQHMYGTDPYIIASRVNCKHVRSRVHTKNTQQLLAKTQISPPVRELVALTLGNHGKTPAALKHYQSLPQSKILRRTLNIASSGQTASFQAS